MVAVPANTLTSSAVVANSLGTAIQIVGFGSASGVASITKGTIDSNIIVEHTLATGASAPSDPHASLCMCLAANVFAGNLTSFGTVITHPRFQAATPTAAAQVVENCWVDTTTSEGYNFSDDDSCGFTDPTDDVATGNDPSLGALADNGGPTQTMLPLVGSPLLNAIPPASCRGRRWPRSGRNRHRGWSYPARARGGVGWLGACSRRHGRIRTLQPSTAPLQHTMG